jgi:hypothetical protein
MTDQATVAPDGYPILTLGQKGSAFSAARDLHTPSERWITDELDEWSFTSKAAAMDYYGLTNDEHAASEGFELQSFSICAECGRVEAEAHGEEAGDWGYRAAMWPCPTARALGVSTD